MRTLLLLITLITLPGCNFITLRGGMSVTGGRPAVQASIEMGTSVMGKRHGISATHEYGMSADEHGANPLIALNLDSTVLDPDAGPVMRFGVRFRGTGPMKEPSGPNGETDAMMLRGAVYTDMFREAETKSGGFGIEIAGGMTTNPRTEKIFEANIVMNGRVKM